MQQRDEGLCHGTMSDTGIRPISRPSIVTGTSCSQPKSSRDLNHKPDVSGRNSPVDVILLRSPHNREVRLRLASLRDDNRIFLADMPSWWYECLEAS